MAERPHAHAHASAPTIDVRERGLPIDGAPQILDERLFVKLTAVRLPSLDAVDAAAAAFPAAAAAAGLEGVLYEDFHDPTTVALVSHGTDPARVLERERAVLRAAAFAGFVARPEYSMLGRTYSSGYENDLRYWLLDRPRATLAHEGWDWGIFYPLRRTGAFNRLSREEQGKILREHGEIGRAYGEFDLAHDLRLACHGLDVHDNDFVIGLIGAALHPLSHVVQSMRGTRQTGEFMDAMGPFFVGRARARSAGADGGR